MKRLSIIFLLLMLIGIAAADIYTIGDGVGTQNYIPFYGLYDYGWSKTIYSAAELNAAGMAAGEISAIAYEVGNEPDNYVSVDQRVYIRQSTANVYNDADIDYPDNAQFSNVYYADYTWHGSGWHYISFSTPFIWDGVSSIEILWENWDGDYSSGPNFKYTPTTETMAVYKYQDGSFPASSGSLTVSRPNIQFLTPSENPPNPAIRIAPEEGWQATEDVVTLSWNPGNGGAPTGYKLYLGITNPPNFMADLGLDTSAQVHNLNFSATYYWQIVPYNEQGDAQDCPIWSFIARDDPVVQSFPWTENFGDGVADWPPPNWGKLLGLYPEVTNPSMTRWREGDWLNNSIDPPNKDSKLNNYGTGRADWLVTPGFNIPAGSYEFRFDLALTDYNNSNQVDTPDGQPDDRFIVAISTTADMQNPVILREWNNTGSEYVYNDIPHTGTVVSLDLGGYTGEHYIAFYAESTVSNGDNDLHIDNVMLRETPLNPILQLGPESWNYGEQIINTSSSKEFTIRNIGAGSLQVNSIDINGASFEFDGTFSPITLLPNESSSFSVNFSPTAVGDHSGTILIGDNRSVTEYSITGSCYDPGIYNEHLPYAENFDAVSTPDLPLGWEIYNATTNTNVTLETYGSSSPYSLPNHLRMYNSSALEGEFYALTPPINVDLTGLRVNFYAKAGSGTTYELTVGLWDGETFDPIEVLNIPTDYLFYSVSFVEYAGNGNRIAFRHGLGGNYRRIYIDDVVIEELPTEPVFSYGPESINYGLIQQNVPVSEDVTITNNGGGSLDISADDITITGDGAAFFSFDDSSLPASLLAGQSLQIPVTALLNSEVQVSATLNIDSQGSSYQVALSAEGLPAGVLIVGDGEENNSIPVNPYYGYSYSQSIFLNSELNIVNQRIEKLYYFWNGTVEGTATNDWVVYMGHSSDAEFTDWLPLEDLTTVFSGEVPLPAEVGWIEIPLSTPFVYNSVDNLVIAVEDNEPDYDSNQHYFFSTDCATNRTIRYYNDSTNPDPAAPPTGTLETAYPNIMLQVGDIPAGAPTAPQLSYPENAATSLPVTGFELSWIPSTEGGVPETFAIYMSQSEETLFTDYYWDGITDFSFDPTQAEINPVTYAYNETWYWTVQAFNGDGDALQTTPNSFQIEAPPEIIDSFPWEENFDLAAALPQDWSLANLDGDSENWISTTSQSHSEPNSFVHDYSSITAEPGQNGWLITPAVQLPTEGSYLLSWWNYNVYPTWLVYNGVMVNTTNDANDPNWVELWSAETAESEWNNAVVSVDEYLGQTVYFAFVYQGYDADSWYIDDVSVFELTEDTFPPVITHLPALNSPRTDMSYTISAEVADDATWNNPIAGVNLYYSTDGGSSYSAAIPMTLTEGLYVAEIPAQTLNTTVHYYIDAVDSEANLAESDVFSFGVDNPTWLAYHTNPDTFFGNTANLWGATVLFQNPFYGTGTPLQLLATDAMSYFGDHTADLVIYSYDGTNMLPLYTQNVLFGLQTNEVFDLSSDEVLIDTPYFIVAYENIPLGNYMLYDESYDYGTSYMNVDGELYTMGTAGSWAIGAYVTNAEVASLDSPVVQLTTNANGNPELSWDAVSGASSYSIEAANNPNPAEWTALATITATSYEYSETDAMKFFRVTALDQTPARNISSGSIININSRSITADQAPKARINTRR